MTLSKLLVSLITAKKILVMSGLLIILMGIFFLVPSVQHFSDHQRVKLTLASQDLEVEVVTTPASITQGLSGRPSLGSDGLLFVLPKREKVSFWMKEMLFDLDFIWIDQNKIVDMTLNVPKPGGGTPDAQLPTYQPDQPVTMVLEVPAGTVTRLNLKIGDQVQW